MRDRSWSAFVGSVMRASEEWDWQEQQIMNLRSVFGSVNRDVIISKEVVLPE